METNTVEENFLGIRDLAEKAADLYDKKIYEVLKKENKMLFEKILNLVDKYAKDYNLQLENDSSKDVKLYELSSRVKKRDSLKEKIIRDQVFYELNKAKNDSQIQKIIVSQFDDLIGLRFLVSLTHDCKSIYELIKDHLEELEGEKISFINIENNPQTMKNEREIYRLKGNFKKYRFELQIKSKVDSAWADIEHMLFYKDFNFSYVQGTNRAVMNKIGDLLDQVDGLMLEVRNSQEGYDNKVQELEFNQYLRKRYVKLVREKLGSSYILTEYKDVIYAMFESNKCLERKGIISLKEIPKEKQILEFEFEEGTKETLLYKNYCNLKNYSIEIMVFESIYYEWISCIEGEYNSLNSDKLNDFLFNLIEKICINFDKTIERNKIQNFAEWISDSTIHILKNTEIECTNRIFFFNKRVLDMLLSFWEACSDVLLDNSVQNDVNIEADINRISEVVLKFLFNERNEEKYINEIIEIVSNSDSEKCSMIIFSMLREKICEKYYKNSIDKSGKSKDKNKIETLLINTAKARS